MKTITVISYTDESPTSHAKAIDRTAKAIPHPTKRVLITRLVPRCDFTGVIVSPPSWLPSTPWNRIQKSRIILEGLAPHVQTDVAIFCQWDGFAINPHLWSDAFLEYDYIGAPWPWKWNPEKPERRVGCGGFSLRSHKWLQACLTLPAHETTAEDGHCCCYATDHFLNLGCKIAPLDVAMKFCLEHVIPEFPNHTINDSFGFHWRDHFGKRPDLIEPQKN